MAKATASQPLPAYKPVPKTQQRTVTRPVAIQEHSIRIPLDVLQRILLGQAKLVLPKLPASDKIQLRCAYEDNADPDGEPNGIELYWEDVADLD